VTLPSETAVEVQLHAELVKYPFGLKPACFIFNVQPDVSYQLVLGLTLKGESTDCTRPVSIFELAKNNNSNSMLESWEK